MFHAALRVRLALCAAASLAALACSTVGARAQEVYIENTSSQLGLLNLTTGAYTPIGTTSVRLGGFAEIGNTVYSLAHDDVVYTVNTTTAAITPVGNTGVSLGGYGLGETSDSTLYATLHTNQLYTLNPTNGAATLVGNLGFNTNCDPSGDASGNLYNAQGVDGNGFYQIDRTTGSGTLLGTNPWGTVFAVTYIQGVMYAINTTGSIYTVDLTTGIGTLASSYNTATVGSVYAAGVSVTPAAAAVPEPGSVALLVGMYSLRYRFPCPSPQKSPPSRLSTSERAGRLGDGKSATGTLTRRLLWLFC